MKIADIITEVQRRWGYKSMRRASDIRSDRKVLSSGIAAVDDLLDGGFPTGKISSLIGIPTSGITTLAYHCIAHTQRRNDEAIYIDLNTVFNGGYAQTCDVDINRLLVVHPPDMLEALTLIRRIILSQVVRLLVLDIRHTENPPLNRLYQSLTTSSITLLVLSPKPIKQTHVRIQVACHNWLQDRKDVIGCQIEATLQQHPYIAIGKTANFELIFGKRVEHD